MKKTLLLLFIFFIAAVLQAEQVKTAGELYSLTVAKDIETSDYHELVSWCTRLGIAAEGSAADLRSRLFRFYEVSPDKDISETDYQQIYIESADNLDYFTIEKIDENYVRISGGVIISIEKAGGVQGETKHRIKADTVLFNFKENYLTASGNIEYILSGDNKTENFRGQKITFNINTEEGLFDKGITEQQKDIDGENIIEKEVVFYFKGDEINKTSENYVLLENGEITSCDLENPHYKIKAEKLWLLAANEWAVLNGLVYIGRVPLLYIPAFLYPGDSMFFNPAFGYRADFGYYMQTTTYFIGEKEEENDSAISFLQNDAEGMYLKRDGLFLTADNEPDEFSKAVQDYGRDNRNYVKLMLDYYTTLGFYSAFDMKASIPDNAETGNDFIDSLLSFISFVKETDLYISMAVTKEIYEENGVYYSLAPDENDEYSYSWQSSYFYNISLPFRYGLELSTGIDFSWLKVDLDFEAWSDKKYKTDFSERSENLQLLSMLSLDTESTASEASEINSENWELSLTINPPMDFLSPYVGSLNVKADTSLYWRYNNDAAFFYPDSRIFPELTASVSGKILPLTLKNTENVPDGENDGKPSGPELQPPWNNKPSREADEIPAAEWLPDAMDDIEIDISDYWHSTELFFNTLSYKISPGYSDKTQFNYDEWSSPEDINISEIEYSFRTLNMDSSISYSADIYENLFSLDNTTSFDLKYNQHYNMESLSETSRETYLNEDRQASEFNVTNNLRLTSYPLVFTDIFDKTNISYSINSIVYQYDYIGEDTADLQNITGHNIGFTMPLTGRNFSQTLKINTDLYPLDFSAEGSYSITWGISSTELNSSLLRTEVEPDVFEWNFDPLTFNEKIAFDTDLWLSNSLSFNYVDSRVEKNILSAGAAINDSNISAESKLVWDLNADNNKLFLSDFTAALDLYSLKTVFKAAHTYDYTFDDTDGWVKSDEQQFIPSTLAASFKLAPELDSLWKNRTLLDFSVNSSLNMDLIRFSESSLSFSLNISLYIFEFLELEFTSRSENSSIYRYFPAYCSEIGVSRIGVISDLLKSFNFFNNDDNADRKASNFNLSSISIGIVHDLHDWDLKIDYSGNPYINTEGSFPEYDWEGRLNIYLAWKAIPDIKTDIKIDNEDISF